MTESNLDKLRELMRENPDIIILIGGGRGMHMPGIYTQDMLMAESTVHVCSAQPISPEQLEPAKHAFSDFQPVSRRFDDEIKRLGKELALLGKEPKLHVAPKPYQQRKFYIKPGSRQDKYSRKR